MEALKLVRRLVYYLLYFVLVVTFFYFVSDAALSFFHEGAGAPALPGSLICTLILSALAENVNSWGRKAAPPPVGDSITEKPPGL